MSSCWANLCPCLSMSQRDAPSLYDDELGELEFENLLLGTHDSLLLFNTSPGHRTAHQQQSASLWQRIASLFRRQQPIFLPENQDDAASFQVASNPVYRPLAAPNEQDFVGADLDADVEIMSHQEIRHKIVKQQVCLPVSFFYSRHCRTNQG